MLKLETNLHGGEPYDAMAEDSGQSVTPADKNWIPDNVSAEAFKVVKNKAGGGGKVRQKVLDEMVPGPSLQGILRWTISQQCCRWTLPSGLVQIARSRNAPV